MNSSNDVNIQNHDFLKLAHIDVAEVSRRAFDHVPGNEAISVNDGSCVGSLLCLCTLLSTSPGLG